MTGNTDEAIRTLIVVTKDYGELGHAMSFLSGQSFASRAVIMLPDNLYAKNKDSLPVSVLRYETLTDILSAVDAHRPHLAFLFSGYLLSHGLLPLGSLGTLLGHLRDRSCKAITSDPFIGLAPELTLDQIDIGIAGLGQPVWTRWWVRLVNSLRDPKARILRVRALEAVTHMYPTSIPQGDSAFEKVAFFNPCIVRAASDLRVSRGERVSAESADVRSRWLFVLSATDLNVQRDLLGMREVMENLLRVLRMALAAERSATLIAPAEIVSRLTNVLPDSIELLSFCPFTEFQQRLLEAEYVFYWNAFSFSQQERVANELPIFLMDQGHLARTIKPYHECARACHFGGWEPPYLDHLQLPTPSDLAVLATAQRPAMRALRGRWQLSPTPDELVNQLSPLQ